MKTRLNYVQAHHLKVGDVVCFRSGTGYGSPKPITKIEPSVRPFITLFFAGKYPVTINELELVATRKPQ